MILSRAFSAAIRRGLIEATRLVVWPLPHGFPRRFAAASLKRTICGFDRLNATFSAAIRRGLIEAMSTVDRRDHDGVFRGDSPRPH